MLVAEKPGTLRTVTQGSLPIGSLVCRGVVRVEVADGAVASQETFPVGARIREVAQGPDGHVYLLTDEPDPEGRVLGLWALETSMSA